MRLVVLALSSVCLAWLAVVGVARAQADEDPQRTAGARALFEEGLSLHDRGELEQAEDRFRRSLSLRDSPSVRFNLASVLARRGRLVEARELFTEVAASEPAPEGLRRNAADQAAELEPRVARLTLLVPSTLHGATVRLDGHDVSDALIGVPMPVDPGTRRLVVVRGSEVLVERTVELADGERRRVDLEAEVPPAALSADVPAAGAGSDDTPWIVLGVGLAAAVLVGVGIAVGVAVDESRYYGGNVSPARITLP